MPNSENVLIETHRFWPYILSKWEKPPAALRITLVSHSAPPLHFVSLRCSVLALSQTAHKFACLLRAGACGFWNIRSARAAPCCGQICASRKLRLTSYVMRRTARSYSESLLYATLRVLAELNISSSSIESRETPCRPDTPSWSCLKKSISLDVGAPVT